MVTNEMLKDVPLLLLANKQDLPVRERSLRCNIVVKQIVAFKNHSLLRLVHYCDHINLVPNSFY